MQARWGPDLATLEKPHSVPGSWGPSLEDSLLISHMQISRGCVPFLPEIRTLAWLQGALVGGTNRPVYTDGTSHQGAEGLHR